MSNASEKHAGAFFPCAQHFVVAGGNFTNFVFNPPPAAPSDFHRIPRGDVDLRNEIRVDASGLVYRQRRTAARQMYSARIEGRQSDVTVVVYQGQNAEKEWKRELAKISGIWHPNFVQPFGIVSSPGLYATIFHDELVPMKQYMEEYRYSMTSTVYLFEYYTGELNDAAAHLSTVVGSRARELILRESVTWIRRSTAQLCLELSTAFWSNTMNYIPSVGPRPSISVLRGGQEGVVISYLTLEQYHEIYCHYLGHTSCLDLKHETIRLGSIISLKEDKNQEIAHIPGSIVLDFGWRSTLSKESLVVMENGWTRTNPSP
ncbi:hypothetical protein B0H11DRAFT_1356865 [Mycena galericulata]|nr:hypothetical protein B0H11DRAFT_1356865 [Mycena galericulata]